MWRSRLPPLLISRLRRRPASSRGGSSSLLASGPSSARNPFLSRAAGSWQPPHVVCYGCGGANQLERRRRHLYLALADDLLLGGAGAGDDEPCRLPDPILRLGFRTVGSNPAFHALGSNIVVTTTGSKSNGGEEEGLTLVYDTETAELCVERSFPRELGIHFDAVAVDDKLCTLSRSSGNNGGGFLYLGQSEPVDDARMFPGAVEWGGDDEFVPYCLRPQRRWTWEATTPTPPPEEALDSGGDHPRGAVSARALHPNGRTIFVSLRKPAYWQELATFSLDLDCTAAAAGSTTTRSSWARRGDWCLPFNGEASYDGDLGAWVGTRTVDDEFGCGHDHLCSCDVVPADDLGLTARPAWTVAESRLTFLEPELKPMRHALVRIDSGGGGGVCYCLVETAVRQGFGYGSCQGDGDRCLLLPTLFHARYGRNGELLAVPLRRQPASYLFSHYVANFHVLAFWI